MTAAARARIDCSVRQIDDILPDCLKAAEAVMSPAGVETWLDGASLVCGLGRGTELVLIFLEDMPEVVRATDETVVADAAALCGYLSRVPIGPAINPFLSTLPAVARRLESADSLRAWFRLVARVADEAPDALVPLLGRIEFLLGQVAIGGLENWVRFGLRAYREQPWRYADFFALQTADAHAALQRERHGTLFVDNERRLQLYQRAFWDLAEPLKPYSLAFDALRKPMPHIDKLGFHVPDVLDDADGVPGLDRYFAMVAHMAAHKLWSRPYLADNFSPFQHLAVEVFEDARVEALAMRRYPGLRRLWMAQHPIPDPDAGPEGWSPYRVVLAMLSRALLDPDHPYRHPAILDYVVRFHARMEVEPGNPMLSAELGVAFLKQVHRPEFHSSKVWFTDTIVPYRDDNRWLWHFLEDAKSADQFHSDHGTPDPITDDEDDESGLLPPQHYPEWDYAIRNYRPDWATVYEALPAAGDAGVIDAVLERHKALAEQIRRVVDRLKPQDRRRVRHQREGDELDLDAAIGAMIDRRCGTAPDERVYQRHVTAGRNVAVMLLLDQSESIKRDIDGAGTTFLQLQQDAATLLAWAMETLGDPFAVAGFASDTRHDVRWFHYKRFAEPWAEAAKARLQAMPAGESTRMGAALRHAARYLAARPEEKKLLLMLSDGAPYDVDVDDPEHLRKDTHAAVAELRAQGIATVCMTLDPKADDYVSEVFGKSGYAVVDQVHRLPEKLTRLFVALTG